MRHKLSRALLLAGIGACAPQLGDKCSTSTDCSIQGDRICDRSQPGGYCTILNCEPGGCGDEGYCVRFQPDKPRLSRTFCMAQCSSTSDCDRDAYRCVRAADLVDPENEGRVAEIIDDDEDGKFCAVRE
jgi:hypothetical protein